MGSTDNDVIMKVRKHGKSYHDNTESRGEVMYKGTTTLHGQGYHLGTDTRTQARSRSLQLRKRVLSCFPPIHDRQ